LVAVHLANASDTSRQISEPQGVFDSAKGLLRAVFYGSCVWVILTVVYLMLTAGG
jgi:hypothetical protein